MNITSEFLLIDDIKSSFNKYSSNVLCGIGDDSAVLSNTRNILISKDLFIENIHFKRAYYSPYEIGQKSLIVNISDIAAMGGGEDIKFLLGLAIPETITNEEIYEILEGIKNAADTYKISLIGGDLSRTKGPLILSITIMGNTDKYIKRDTARPGESLFLTGYVGNSGAGMELLQKGHLKGSLQFSHKRPKARIFEANCLSKHDIPASMIDISDGMVADLYHILKTSGFGAEIYSASIPLSYELRDAAGLDNTPDEYALYGGEDYELIFTTNKHNENFSLYDEERELYYNFYHIGKIIDEKPVLYYFDKERKYSIQPKGYTHF